MSFDTLGLHESLARALTAANYTQPTAVQSEAIPAGLAGKDLMVSARTGSGKTAAFMLPALTLVLKARAERAAAPRPACRRVTQYAAASRHSPLSGSLRKVRLYAHAEVANAYASPVHSAVRPAKPSAATHSVNSHTVTAVTTQLVRLTTSRVQSPRGSRR